MLIVLDGDPIAKCRHRYNVRGSYVQSYDPQKKEVEQTQREIMRILEEMPQDNIPEPGDALRVDITFHMPIPKSASKKKREELNDGRGVPHIKRPDLSNLVKYYEDAGNGILWPDDCQIAEMKVMKRYSKWPKTVIKIDVMDWE